ncbi:MAG: hypothetical protein Q9167_000585 [Letrouitia subvulpina]
MSVDLFEKSETRVSLAIHSQTPFVSSGNDDAESRYKTEHTDLQKTIGELEDLGQVDVVHGLAILSLIGTGLKKSTGIAGKLFCALGDNAINIDMISQGASEISISCVIEEREANRALNVVHTNLFTFIESD